MLLLIGSTSYDVDNATHTYTVLGTYIITCVAINAIGNTTIQYVVTVQIPVSDQFIVNSSSPVTFTTTGTYSHSVYCCNVLAKKTFLTLNFNNKFLVT